MTPKVSIITPIYNAEKTLHKTIKSIIAQTLQDWELLLIDDGSTDTSSKICDVYATEDKRITVIHKYNEGVAMARKIGIDMAKGEYSIHVDADDWIEPTMLEELYDKAKTENADVVIADYFVNTGGRQTVSKQCPASLEPVRVLTDMFTGRLFGALWNKLIRTELYRTCNARFFLGINYCEDLLICVQLLQHVDLKIAYLPKAFYHYVSNDASITRNFTRRTYEMRIRFKDKLVELLSIPQVSEVMERVRFGIFTEAFIYDVLTEQEINEGLVRYAKQIRELKSLKWRLGFGLLALGMKRWAHKLIHY